MKLTLLVFTVNGENILRSFLSGLRAIGDELVIAVDDSTVDSSEMLAREFSSKVYSVPHEVFCTAGPRHATQEMLKYCSGDWVFRIDHDETLSPFWSNPDYVASLLDDRYATHYWIPRRWLLPPGDRFISSRHWYPDYQLRLFRNIPSLIQFSPLPHEPLIIAGEARYLTEAWLNHWDFVWHDRLFREAKVEFYRSFSPYTGGDFYLYEDYGFETEKFDYAPTRHEGRQQSSPGTKYCVSIRLIDAPRLMYAGATGSVLIEITNHSGQRLYPFSNFVYAGNVSLSYHWYHASDPPAVHQWDGDRRPLPGRLEPGESLTCFLTVRIPGNAGDYLLQADLVEEGVTWYSYHCPIISFPVKVISA